MIDPGTIVALLAGGAIAKTEKLGGDLVSDAYEALKRVLVDVYGFASDRLLEKAPSEPKAIEAAEADIAAAALQDEEVIRRVEALGVALSAVPNANWSRAGVIIEGLVAFRDLEVGRVSAGSHGVVIRNVRATTGDLRIGDVEG